MNSATILPVAPFMPLQPLPYPVSFFVHRVVAEWPEIFVDVNAPPSVDDWHWKYQEPAPCWVVQTYLQLRRRGLDVHLSSQLQPGCINVIYRWDVGMRSRADRCFIVSCQSDSPRPWIGQLTVVQNPACVIDARRDFLIQHWPQPALVPRDPMRGTTLERLAFKGNVGNLWEGFRSDAFRAELAKMGIELTIATHTADRRELRWHDYSLDDAVLAVRDLTEADYFLKPASKLINAWLAGVPALLGPENAYQALRRSELDYFEVQTPDDALAALSRLKREPELYKAVVENGLTRAREVSVDQIAKCWRDLLAGPAAEQFERWKRQGLVRRSLRPLGFVARAARDRIEIRRYINRRDHGYRPISGRHT
jgi:hypothetical protein